MEAYWLATSEVPSSNTGKGENFSMKRSKKEKSLVNLSGLVKSVTKKVTGCLRPTKVAIFEI